MVGRRAHVSTAEVFLSSSESCQRVALGAAVTLRPHHIPSTMQELHEPEVSAGMKRKSDFLDDDAASVATETDSTVEDPTVHSAYEEAQDRKRVALFQACFPETAESDYRQLGVGYESRPSEDDDEEQHPAFIHRELSNFGADQLQPGNDPVGFDYNPLGFGFEQIVENSRGGSSGFDYATLGHEREEIVVNTKSDRLAFDYNPLGYGYDQLVGGSLRRRSGFDYETLGHDDHQVVQRVESDRSKFNYNPLGYGYEQLVGKSLSTPSGFEYDTLGLDYESLERSSKSKRSDFNYNPLGFGYEQIVGGALRNPSGFDYSGLGRSHYDSDGTAEDSDGDTDVEAASSEQLDDSSFESKPSVDGHACKITRNSNSRAPPAVTSHRHSAPSAVERLKAAESVPAEQPASGLASKASSILKLVFRRDVVLLVALALVVLSGLTVVSRSRDRPAVHVIRSESNYSARRALAAEIDKALLGLDASLGSGELSLADLQRAALSVNGVASRLMAADIGSPSEATERLKQAQAAMNELALRSSEDSAEAAEVAQAIERSAAILREISSAINRGSRARISSLSDSRGPNPQSRLKPPSAGGLQSHIDRKVASLLGDEDEELLLSAEHIKKSRKLGGSSEALKRHAVDNLAVVAVDHAVSIRGGKIVSERGLPTSSPYVSSLNPLQYVKHVVGPLKAHTDPRVVISHFMPTLGSEKSFLRQCYCFKGPEGSITVEFRQPVVLDMLEVFHLGLAETKRAYKGSAPRDFSARGHLSNGGAVDLGSFTYSTAPGFEELQSFPITSSYDGLVKAVTFDFTSNGGSPMTCVYRLRAIGRAEKEDSSL